MVSASGQIDNLSALIQVMAWHMADYQPLSKPRIIQLTDAYMHSTGLNELILIRLMTPRFVSQVN